MNQADKKALVQAKKKADAMARAERRAKYDALIQQRHVLCVEGDASRPITVDSYGDNYTGKWIVKPM